MKQKTFFPTVSTVSLLVIALLLLLLAFACPRAASAEPVSQPAKAQNNLLTGTAPGGNLADVALSKSLDAAENERIYDEIWILVSQHFLYRERLKQWAAWRHRYDGKMPDRQSSQLAINTMLGSLADEYTFFKDESSTQERKNLRQKAKVVEYKMLEGQIGYIHIGTFNSLYCVPETKAALVELNSAHGLILDLRDNWGGSITSTFEIFSLFTNSGKFVTMKGTADGTDYREELSLIEEAAITQTNELTVRGKREANLSGLKPLIILVNENTKSASEMLAGALRDNGRAVVLGLQTYGKGIVQRVWEFPNNTSIKISSALYYLPNGTSIHKIGLSPDLTVGNQVNVGKTLTVKLSKPKLKRHLANSTTLVLEAEGTMDKQLNEAQAVLKRKLVSLAKP